MNAIKLSGVSSKEHRAVFLGAGSAGVGVAKQIVELFIKEGLSEEEAKRRFWFVDSSVSQTTVLIIITSPSIHSSPFYSIASQPFRNQFTPRLIKWP